MQITVYRRSYPVAGAPEALTLTPHSDAQRHTFTAAGGRVYEAKRGELHVVVPDDARLDPQKHVLCWAGAKGLVRSTAREVVDLARAGASGFRMGK